jgi:dihydrofolate reductase
MITLILAMDLGRGIGIENRLPWNVPEDLAHFKRTTLDRPIIMGRKTFDSIGRALPRRRNIVVTRQPAWQWDAVEVASSLAAAVDLVAGDDAFVIGGAQIYSEAIHVADRMVITHIHGVYSCDTFFPEIAVADWAETDRDHFVSAVEGIPFSIATYERRRVPVKP